MMAPAGGGAPSTPRPDVPAATATPAARSLRIRRKRPAACGPVALLVRFLFMTAPFDVGWSVSFTWGDLAVFRVSATSCRQASRGVASMRVVRHEPRGAPGATKGPGGAGG